MSLAQAVISGAVQGITEFFPISSSGHLVILHSLFRIQEPQFAFDIFLHIGTLGSIFIFFWPDIVGLFGKNKRLLLPIIIASIPTFIIGFFFKESVERFFGMPKVVGWMLIVTGAWLTAATIYSARSVKRWPNGSPGVMSSLLVGIAQGIAIMPGISRSGATIATGILAGLSREEAFRFAFLISIPAVSGASLLKAHKIGASLVASDAAQFAAGALTALVVGVLSIKVLLNAVKGNKLYLFGIYCFFAGIITIILI
jgi:undecaprenyl-diphosphatase